LAEKVIKVDTKQSNEIETILPTRTLQELIRILSIVSVDNLEVYLAENQALFCFDEIEIISRAIEGNYPDYQQIIPKESKSKVIADREDLVKKIKTTSLFSRSGINDITLKVVPKDKEIIVSAVNAQLGENVSRLKATTEGEENEIVFNHRYLLDGLQNINSEKVVVEIINNTNPGVLKPEGSNSYLYIIMPIKQ
jgi:DNA polymerase-3 subunit beta